MVSVIIVSWNHATWLPECVSSLRGQSGGIPVEIIVVDSGSHDRTLEVADSLGARVVACENHGFAYANNRGLEHVTGEWVLFLNPDTTGRGGNSARSRLCRGVASAAGHRWGATVERRRGARVVDPSLTFADPLAFRGPGIGIFALATAFLGRRASARRRVLRA